MDILFDEVHYLHKDLNNESFKRSGHLIRPESLPLQYALYLAIHEGHNYLLDTEKKKIRAPCPEVYTHCCKEESFIIAKCFSINRFICNVGIFFDT